jgi:predicted nucleic acid-binding protein
MGRTLVKIADALRGVQRLCIETAPLIYYVEEHPKYIAKMDAIIQAVDDQSIEAFSSIITLTEVLNHPMKTGNKKLEQEYRDILVNSDSYRLVMINLQIAESAADLRARYGLRTPDALHGASALHTACDAFLTNDTRIKRVTELPILILDELEL